MSDGTTPTVDPRFDPRFQRGYVPDALSPGTVDHVTPAGARTPPPARAASAARRADASDDHPAGDSTTEDPAAAILELLEYAEAERLVSADREAPAVAGIAAAEPAAADPAAVQFATPVLSGVYLEPDDGPVWSATRWLWIAIGACLVFVLGGSVLYWIQASDQSMYTGPGPADLDETTRMVVTMLSPALVQAGVLGVVAVLVAWAVRGARHAERRR